MNFKKFKLLGAKVMSALMICSLISSNIPYAETVNNANDENDLILHYKFAELNATAGTSIVDYSGKGNNGTLKGNNASIVDGVLTLPGGSVNSGAAYVELPTGMFDNKNSLTISLWLKNETGAGNYSAMFFGKNQTPPSQYWLLNPCAPNGSFKSVFTNSLNTSSPWTTEKGISSGTTTDNNWAMYTTVIEANKITAYYNGVCIGSDVLTRTVSDFGSGLVSYLGKSSYSDKFYKGGIKDVKVYNGALLPAEIKNEYYSNADEALVTSALNEDKDALSLEKTTIINDITLPTVGSKNGSSIVWESSDENYITSTGVVTRPTDEDKVVTLTATLTLAGRTVNKSFDVTVLSDNPANDLDELVNDFLLDAKILSNDIILPTTAGKDSKVTWVSSDENYVTADGKVTRPAIGDGNKEVTLTAQISYKDLTASKEFTVTVIEEYYGYLMSYILTGNTSIGNSLHLAYSLDGKKYTELNSNSGIAFAKNTSTTKNDNPNNFKSPFLFRKNDGTYGLIATNNDNYSYVYILESKDLINFTNEAKLTLDNSGKKVLTPQCYYDTTNGEYVINWTDGNNYYKNTSKDLKTASTPVEDKYEVATNDATVIPQNAVKGAVLPVTKVEYDRVINKLAPVVNTGVEEVKLYDSLELPIQVTASYSDGSTATIPVEWNEEDIADIDLSKPGTYEISGTVESKEYENPFIEEKADPCITKGSDGYYYFTASYPMYGSGDSNGYSKVTLRRSETIEGLQNAEELTIWDSKNSTSIYRFIWAPEIHEINGKWYIYFTGSTASNSVWAIRPQVLQCEGDNPMDANAWVEKGLFQKVSSDKFSFNNFSLDMTYFENNGTHYAIWAQKGIASDLYMATINPEEPWKLTSEPMLLTTPEYSWERIYENVNEGPAVIKKNGKVYVTFSAAATGVEYCIGLLTADADSDLMNPDSWTKTPYPILTSADVDGEYGPGHNSFTVDENGNDVFVYHARSQECYENKCDYANQDPLYDPCRDARVKNVHWAVDGTPILKMTNEQAVASEFRNIKATIVVSDDNKKEQDKPENLSGVAPTTYGGNNGKITGVTTAMEYSLNKDGQFIKCTENEITGLKAGEYYVRYAETNTHFASTAVKVVVEEGKGSILHYDMTVENGYLVDKSGNNNGVINNLAKDDIVEKENGNTLLFNNDSNPLYVEIPEGTVNGLKNFSISALVNWKGGVNASWLYTIGSNSGNYLFVTPSNNSSKLQTGFANGNNLSGWQTEKGVGDTSRLSSNQWSMVTITFSSDTNTLALYKDGILVGENKEVSYEIANILKTGTPNGYIGKSYYSGDPYFSGELADFNIFNKALTAEEVSALKEEYNELILELSGDVLNYEYILKDNEGKDKVTSNLNLPKTLGNIKIDWTSSNEAVIDKNGTVIRPSSVEDNKNVTLMAVMTLGGKSITKTFDVKVIKELKVSEKLKLVKEDLVVNNIDDVRGNLTLPIIGEYDSVITWESSNSSVIDTKVNGDTPGGIVTRQKNDVEVTLTATITIEGESITKEFTAKVKAKVDELDYDAYIFTYFIGEEYEAGEQVYLGTSKDGLNWEEVNNHQPILTSELGEKGVRDPFIIRSPEGDKFYLIATDLRIYNGNGWGAAQMSGSQSLMIWESTDLVNWSEQRMVKVALDTAGCTWAPEVFYDKTTGEYVVFWASKDNARPDKDGKYHHRIYYAKTRDFYTFTEPEVYFSIELDNNSATDVIDTTMIENNGTYYRWTKNEVDKTIFMEKSDSILGEWTAIDSNVEDYKWVEGPTAFKFNDRDEWCLLLDEHGGIKYFPLVTDDLESGNFIKLDSSEYSLPKGASQNGPRHGTVIPVTKEEYDRVMLNYGNVEVVDENIPSAVLTTEDGTTLPSEIEVEIGGNRVKTEVEWDLNKDTFKTVGTTTIKGTLVKYNKAIEIKVRVVSPNLIYYIDSGQEKSSAYDTIKSVVNLRNEVADKEYTDGSWGYYNPNGEYLGLRSSNNTDEYSAGWWAKSGKDIVYKITLEAGEYSTTAGFQEWWGVTRAMNFYIEYTNENGELIQAPIEENIVISGSVKKTSTGTFTLPIDTEVTFRISKYPNSSDPVISWLSVDKLSNDEPNEEIPVDKTELKEAIEEAKNIDTSLYTEATVKALKEAIESAEVIYANETATEEEVSNGVIVLKDAINGLEEKEDEQNEETPVDKTVLKEAIEEAKKVNTSLYTEVTVKALKEAIKNAEEVYANETATEEDVSDAEKSLKSAIGALEEKQKEDDATPSVPVNPDNSDKENGATDDKNPTKIPETGAAVGSTVILLIAIIAIGYGTFMVVNKKEKSK